MIGIQLKGRLGNQMFQYAVARTLADKLGCALAFAGNTRGPRFGLIGHWIGLDKHLSERQQNGVLRTAFQRGPNFWEGRAVELALPLLKSLLFPRSFTPRKVEVIDGVFAEEFDPAIFRQTSGTWLMGYFQSEKYFAANADQVHHWFRPDRNAALRVEELMTQWPYRREQMAALHLRRGDYARQKKGLDESGQGWLLPISYYHDALAEIPGDVGLAVFSDDPNWAAHQFSHRKCWISRGNPAVVDMFLIAQCRWNVIANSSFSWWAAWLNMHSDKIVLAPKYHLGWRIGRWYHRGIEVAGWNYLQVAG